MKIIAVGWNYRGHNAEMNQKETPQNPGVGKKSLRSGSLIQTMMTPTQD